MDKPQIHEHVRQDQRVINSLRCKYMSVWGAGGEKIVKKNDREYIYIIFIYTKYIYIMYTYIHTYICVEDKCIEKGI